MVDYAELTKLHHTSVVDVLPASIDLNKYVFHEGTQYAYEDVSLPKFLPNEYFINDTPP